MNVRSDRIAATNEDTGRNQNTERWNRGSREKRKAESSNASGLRHSKRFSAVTRRASYDAFAGRRVGMRVAAVTLAAFARAIERFFIVKQRSRAWSTFSSTMFVISRETSEISETTRNFARSSMRFSRNERFFERARKVRLLSTSTTS